jgi:hypothetical protein
MEKMFGFESTSATAYVTGYHLHSFEKDNPTVGKNNFRVIQNISQYEKEYSPLFLL